MVCPRNSDIYAAVTVILCLLLLLQSASPAVVSKTDPPYPPLAKTAGIEGTVRVSVTVAPDGHVTQAAIVSSSNPLLLTGLLNTIRQWRFETTESGGVTVLDVPFSLSGEAAKVNRGVISGTLRDPANQPKANVTIVASRLIYIVGRSRLEVVGSAMTDDRGMYRIQSLPAGTYFVSAAIQSPSGILVGAAADYASSTYFPGSGAFEKAASVNVDKDKETPGIDFSIVRSNHVDISGRILREVNDGPLRPLTSAAIYSIPHTDDGMDFEASSQSVSLTDPSLSFAVRHMEPGLMDLVAVVRDQTISYFGRVTVDARGDVQDVVIPVSRGAAITGVVVTDVKDIDLSRLRVSYDAQENRVLAISGSTGVSAVNASGSFQFLNIPLGAYAISSMVGMPPDAYVSSMTLGDQTLPASGAFKVSGGTAQDMQIRIAAPGGEIRGTAVDAAGRSIPNCFVTLVPEGEGRSNFLNYRRGMTDTAGAFRLRGVAPGRYRIFAWQTDPASGDENPQFLSRYEARSREVQVNPAQTISEVSVIVN